MNLILLCLNLVLPSIFFFLGRKRKGREKMYLLRESLLVFLSSLILSPIVYVYFPLNIKAFFSGTLMLCQFLLLTVSLYKKEKNT